MRRRGMERRGEMGKRGKKEEREGGLMGKRERNEKREGRMMGKRG